ncbi:MAG: SpoIIE family protein phosphatase [Candidatus Kapabacteria bacterium]|nr:SpoIIE family protein phosphatase [Candidatus Kapabacteria bacterium]MDT3741474.1 SpoIIE family protein phosphatase [Candidatus Kapabacteria bacterium]
MVKFLKNITSKGIISGMTAHEEKGVIISNYIILIAAAVSFVRIFMFYINGDTVHSSISLIASILFVFAYFMNIYHHFDFAKYFILFTGNAAILMKELMSGGTSNQLYIVIASYGVVFLLFSIKDRVKIILALLIPTTTLILSVFFTNIIAEPVILEPDIQIKEKFFGALSAAVIIVLVIAYFVKKSTDNELRLIQSNDLLKAYNDEMSIQKNIIEDQNVELAQINDDLIAQKHIIEEQHTSLTSSIEYARNIQSVILPSKDTLDRMFPNNFLLFKPKDVVSGDFYWFADTEDWKFIAVVDCTGHGVPGAIMSMIGNDLLNQIVLLQGISSPSEILKRLHYGVRSTLKQDTNESRQMDGMEVCIIAFDKHQPTAIFAGAKRPLRIVGFNSGVKEYSEIRGDKHSIGGHQKEVDRFFTNHQINLQNRELIFYLSTDGYADQMDENAQKYSTKRFVTLLESISDKPMEEQNQILENEFNSHKGSRNQIDDVTILGVRL